MIITILLILLVLGCLGYGYSPYGAGFPTYPSVGTLILVLVLLKVFRII
jgi:hypothetical protein